MNLSWNGIANIAKKVGSGLNAAAKWFIAIEPYAVTAITPFCPEAAMVANIAYGIVGKVEADIATAGQPGSTKASVAITAINDGVLPTLQYALQAAGKTINVADAGAVTNDLITAIVAENNAQAKVVAILQQAKTDGKFPDGTALGAAQAEVAKFTTAVMNATHAIQATIKSVQPA